MAVPIINLRPDKAGPKRLIKGAGWGIGREYADRQGFPAAVQPSLRHLPNEPPPDPTPVVARQNVEREKMTIRSVHQRLLKHACMDEARRVIAFAGKVNEPPILFKVAAPASDAIGHVDRIEDLHWNDPRIGLPPAGHMKPRDRRSIGNGRDTEYDVPVRHCHASSPSPLRR
jgi:hypothetical protein